MRRRPFLPVRLQAAYVWLSFLSATTFRASSREFCAVVNARGGEGWLERGWGEVVEGHGHEEKKLPCL